VPLPAGDHNDASNARREDDSGEVRGPELDRDVPELILAVLEIVTRPWRVQFDEDDVAGAQGIGRIGDRLGRALPGTEDRNRADVGVRADPRDTECVVIGAECADDCRAVVSPVRTLRAADRASLILQHVLVAELPAALDVDDANALAAAARSCPREASIDACRRPVEIALLVDEVGRGRRGFLPSRRRHGPHRGRIHARLDVRGLDDLLVQQRCLQRIQTVVGRVDAIEARQIRHVFRHSATRGGDSPPHALFGAEHRRQHSRVLRQHALDRPGAGAGRRCDHPRGHPESGAFSGQDNELALGRRRVGRRCDCPR